jgi:methionyl-tRNA formyltransferase
MPGGLKIVFMGTPDFAVESLRVFSQSRHCVLAVVTAPDKPAGRGKKLMPPPVKEFALQAGIKILQPESLKDPRFITTLKELNADAFVVVAFRMLPEVVWSIPPKGTINLHASLLPDYRGAAPINHVIINGETETGITTFFIEKDIDTGKIIMAEKVQIPADMNAGGLHDLLMEKGSKLLLTTLDELAAGKIQAIAQDELAGEKTLHSAPRIFRENCRINWEMPAEKIYNLIRGLSPYPAAWTEIQCGNDTELLKVYDSRYESDMHEIPAGTHYTAGKSFFKVAAGKGYIYLTKVQIAGRKIMGIGEFIRGFKNSGCIKIMN